MDRDWLEAQLAAGRSIESIAREVGQAPVDGRVLGQEARPHSAHAARHAAAGRVIASASRLVEDGLSVRQIAERLGVGATTVRHWLRRTGSRRAARDCGGDARAAADASSASAARHGCTD